MPVSGSSRAVLVAGFVLLLAFATGGAAASVGGPSTASVEPIDWPNETDGEPSATAASPTDPVEELLNATGDIEDDTGFTNASDLVGESASDSDDATDGGDPLDGDELVDGPATETGLEDTVSAIHWGLASGDGSLESVGDATGSRVGARLDVGLGPANSSVAVGIGNDGNANDPTESEGDSGDDDSGVGAPGDGAEAAIDAGLVGALGGLTLLGGAGAASGGATAGSAVSGAGAAAAGSSGATSGLVGQTVSTLLRLLGGISGLAHKLPFSLLRYSRYDDSDPLDHETRRDLYERIEAEPGRYLSALDADTDGSLSTIRHHLTVLEDEGLVEARKQHGKRRFYPARTDDVALAAALDEPAKAGVLTVLAESGEVHNGRIADALDVDPSTVSHHLSALEDDGLVDRRRDGRAVVNTLAPGVEDALDERDGRGRATGRTDDGPVAVLGDD